MLGTFDAIGQRHLCNIYRDRMEQFSLIADFMLDGLKKGARCIYIVDENTKDGVLGAFKDMRHAADSALLDRLVFLTKEDSYLKGGSFDPDRMIRLLQETQEKALAEGCPALRVTGEMTWIFSKLPGVDKLLEYESKLNYFFPNSKTMAICQYNENKFDAKTLMGVLNTHPVVGIYGELFENPYYIPPDVYLASLGGKVPVAMYEKARNDVIKRMSVEKERRRAELALEETNKKLTILSSLNSHDLSNQLTVIVGCSDFALEKNLDPATRNLFQKISTAGQKMREQLEFAKAYQDLGTAEPKWIELGPCIASAIDSLKVGRISARIDSLKVGGISFRIDVLDIKVLADPMLEKVFTNLVDNSIRHGERVRNIRLSASEDSSDGLRIIYEDDGAGIAAEDKERIFDKGFGRNTGLGLYLCREILALTGASLRENGEPQNGARFEIAIPPSHWART